MRVPIVTWPHFGDQPMNSDLIVAAKAGVKLGYKTREPENDMSVQLTFKDPIFDANKVYECFSEVLKNK